jgi:hypothetical protein
MKNVLEYRGDQVSIITDMFVFTLDLPRSLISFNLHEIKTEIKVCKIQEWNSFDFLAPLCLAKQD